MAKILTSYGLPEDIAKDLLATKPEKECKHKFIDSFDVIGKVSEFCCKCGKQNPNCGIRWDIPRITTPSPLDEIEEVKEITGLLKPITKFETEKKLNQLIRNQNKIISYLKKR